MRQTDYVILGLLTEGPLSGYDIKKLVDLRFGFFWSESFGQIFPALRKLSEMGLIEASSGASQGGRAKKTYCILPAGVAAVKSWMATPVERESYRLELLLRMYFGHFAAPETLAGQVEAFRQKHDAEARLLEQFRLELEPLRERDANHPHILRVIDLGLRVNRAYLDWSRETLEELERSEVR